MIHAARPLRAPSRFPARSALPALLVALVLCLLPTLAAAQEASDSTAGEPATGFATAREAYAAYLDQMARHRVDLVVESGLFDLLAEEGARADLASQLYEVLLRTDAAQPPEVGRIRARAGEIAIPIRSERGDLLESLVLVDSPERGWRFAARNETWIPDRFARLANAPLREEMLARLDFLERQHRRLRASLPASLLERSFVIENWQWIALATILALSMVLGRLVQLVLSSIARRGAGRAGVLGIASELKRFNRPAGLFLAATLFGVLLPLAGLEGQILAALAFCARFVGTFAGLWAAYRAVDLGCGILEERAKQSRNRFDDILVPLLRTTLHVFVVIVGIVYLAAEWTDQLWSIVAGLSIGSLAIGFAARDSIENLFGTFTVLVDKPFTLGDWIVVEGIEGTVESVGFRSTR
ncbi:MAG: mechanosensitive ion channel domain-containing protein, partial [Planctomycetota bacterium]